VGVEEVEAVGVVRTGEENGMHHEEVTAARDQDHQEETPQEKATEEHAHHHEVHDWITIEKMGEGHRVTKMKAKIHHAVEMRAERHHVTRTPGTHRQAHRTLPRAQHPALLPLNLYPR